MQFEYSSVLESICRDTQSEGKTDYCISQEKYQILVKYQLCIVHFTSERINIQHISFLTVKKTDIQPVGEACKK